MRPSPGTFLMSRLIHGRTLGDTVVMAFPHNVSIWRKGKETLNGLAGTLLAVLKNGLSRSHSPDLDVSSTVNPRPNT